MKRAFLLTISIFFFVLFVGCGNENESQKKTTLTISAAVSLTDALDEIKKNYEEEHPVELRFNFGGSGSLAQQIQQGAPSDVFISANQDWMDILEDEDLIQSETRLDITGNNLVLITSESSSLAYESIEDISTNDIEKIAIGDPESVPAGKYVKETLHNSEMWNRLEDNLVLTKNVRQVLTYVESEDAEIGFVYESEALSSGKIKILTTVDKDLHDPIIYPISVLAETKHKEEAIKFIDFMETDKAQKVLEKYGFKK